MQFTENNQAIIDGNRTIACDPLNADYKLILNGHGEVNDADYIAPTLDDVAPYATPTPTNAELNQPHLDYLAATDWYVVRFVETDLAIPAEITAARQMAREAIV